MTDPHTSTIVAAAGGISLVAGTVLGLPVPALVFGLVGGLAALKIDQTQRGLAQRVTTVALGTMCAAAAAHPAAMYLHPDGTPTEALVPLAAIVIGAGAEALLRTVLMGVVNRVRQISGLPPAPPPDGGAS